MKNRIISLLVTLSLLLFVTGCGGRHLKVGESLEIEETYYLVFSQDDLVDSNFMGDTSSLVTSADFALLQSQTKWDIPENLVVENQQLTYLPLPVTEGCGEGLHVTYPYGLWLIVKGTVVVKDFAEETQTVNLLLPLDQLTGTYTVYKISDDITCTLELANSNIFEVVQITTEK